MLDYIRYIYESLFSYETRLRFYKFRHPQRYRDIRSTIFPSDKGDFSLKPYDENHCLFIHITKTAGTSVARSMFGYLPYHYTAIDYRVIYGRKTFDEYFKFAFVRNPWDRLYSAYRFLKSGGWNDKDRQWYEDNLSSHDSFDDFVEHWLSPANIETHRHFWPQYHFVCDNNRILLDMIGYFETLEQDFDAICERLDINASIGEHNMNPGDDYRDVYTDSMRDKVASVYATDIEMFGYEFDGISKRITA